MYKHPLHKEYKGAINELPAVFPRRSMLPVSRLAKEVQAGLKALRRASLDQMDEEMNALLDAYGTDLEAMSKRAYTIFRHVHRLWLAAAKRHTQTLCTWGREALLRNDGVLCYRAAGGNIALETYNRLEVKTLDRVLAMAGKTYYGVMGTDGDPEFAQASAEALVVDYLRPRRRLLRVFDGRLKPRLQGLLDELRQWVLYEYSGNTREDVLYSSPTGQWDLANLPVEEPDDIVITEDDYEE